MTLNSNLAEQVKINLIHYNQWSEVTLHSINDIVVISGKPPNKLDDKNITTEWVVPSTNSKLTVSQINDWFTGIENLQGKVARVTIAIVNDDGSIVYYFIHNDIVKPRQN